MTSHSSTSLRQFLTPTAGLTCLDIESKVEKGPISQGTEEVVATLEGGHQDGAGNDLCGEEMPSNLFSRDPTLIGSPGPSKVLTSTEHLFVQEFKRGQLQDPG